jgi:hypothetical protein
MRAKSRHGSNDERQSETNHQDLNIESQKKLEENALAMTRVPKRIFVCSMRMLLARSTRGADWVWD